MSGHQARQWCFYFFNLCFCFLRKDEANLIRNTALNFVTSQIALCSLKKTEKLRFSNSKNAPILEANRH